MAEALGLHVEREVAKARRRSAAEPDLSERDAEELLARVEDSIATLEALAARLEFGQRRARDQAPAAVFHPPV